MLVKLQGSAVVGLDAIPIGIEVNVSAGTNYYIVGLPDSSIKESLQRVESAIKQSGFKMPRTKIVINLFPADIRKTGAVFDLPIAIGILVASEQIQPILSLEQCMLMGELGLDGDIRSITGVLPIALQAVKNNFKKIILPHINTQEASLVKDIEVLGVSNIQEVVDILEGRFSPVPTKLDVDIDKFTLDYDIDFADVKGQENVKRALEIAAAGSHNTIMIGPPGVGKTMLARRLPTILPPLSFDEVIEVTKIYSVNKLVDYKNSLMFHRPFRAPHHTVSDVALVGGGSDPSPGEISLAHKGVLFLDELPEFKRGVLEVLRQPLEERKIQISRAKVSVSFPANFVLVASMNPCPCGFYNHPEKRCTCPSGAIHRYLQKISGPLLDRIDIHIEVTPVPVITMLGNEKTTTSAEIRSRVLAAKAVQQLRFEKEKNVSSNAEMSNKQLKKYCELDTACLNLLNMAVRRLQLSVRAHNGIIKVARTIADLSASNAIKTEHIAEAIQFRCLDRETWGAL